MNNNFRSDVEDMLDRLGALQFEISLLADKARRLNKKNKTSNSQEIAEALEELELAMNSLPVADSQARLNAEFA